MANYIWQPQFSRPTRGQQTISHRVQLFSETSNANLQTAINNFFTSLIALPETPQIISIEYPGAQDTGANKRFLALVHYVLFS